MKNWMEKLVRAAPWCLLLGVVFVGLAVTHGRLNRIRREEELTMVEPVENAPPVVAFTTVALGGFRGLVADWLWLRSRRMQDEGNYFEMVQLADWIVKLQPRFTAATAFLAWNMSYNISVTFSDFEDRWRWVRRGIELIRDEALVYNPGDPELYHQLAWIYRHKVGQNLDDANRYYKTQMAREFMGIFGVYPPDWAAWRQAPETLDELDRAVPSDSPVRTAMTENGWSLRDVELRFRATGGLPDAIANLEWVDQELAVLERSFRRRWLRETKKLEVEVIQTLNETYGALDWRLPQAHAIYWAYKGLEQAEGRIHMSCERLVTHALNQAFYEGRLLYVREGDAEFLDLAPNINVIDVALQRHKQNLENHPGNIGFKAGYKNFLIDAVVVLYTYGEQERAREIMRIGREEVNEREFRGTVEQFALRNLGKDVTDATQKQAAAAVRGYLYQACRSLAYGDYERAGQFERIGRLIREKYMARYARDESQRQRRGLPPYSVMKQNTVDLALKQFPPLLAARLEAAIRTLIDAPEE